MGIDLARLGNRFGSQESSTVMQIQNLIKMISQDWRKSIAQLSEGNADPDHYAVASHTTWSAFALPENWRNKL